MTRLAEVLTSEDKKSRVVTDTLQIIDAEVADKGGISGMAIKAGYKAVKGIRPGFLEKVVSDLLPEFADAVEPIYREAVEKSRPVRDYFVENRARVADSLLAITDGRARRTKSGVVKATYDRLRGSAKKNVEEAVPRLGGLIEKHT
ncbi:MAG: hypothetical protein M5U28_53745 [Sandaracinaceae bacterium]|nr:hypothetical protein [Sandaracinaceae bacterium]